MSISDFNAVLKWWLGLENDRGGRAELRRAHNPTEVVFLPAYQRLNAMLNLPDKEALACVAGVCAHVKNHVDGEFTGYMSKGDKPIVSPRRFRRLLAINDRTELYHAMIRVVRLLGGKVNVVDLAKTVYWWNEGTKKQLAYDYYANANTKEE